MPLTHFFVRWSFTSKSETIKYLNQLSHGRSEERVFPEKKIPQAVIGF